MNPDSYNDGNVCQFIDGRFQEKFNSEEEKWTFFSFIDYYLKRCSSKEDSGRLVEEIFGVCRKHGYIPQYNVSGWATFYTDNSRFSRDAKFVITPNANSTMLIFSGEMRPYAMFFNRGTERVDLSPNGDRLVNFYHYGDESCGIEVWDTENFRIVFESDTVCQKVWWTGPKSFYFVNAEGLLVKVDDLDNPVEMNISLEGDFAFAVDEVSRQVLSLGDNTNMINLDTGEYYWFDTGMSLDSEIYLSKDGFRVFSDGVLYKVGEELDILYESEGACISRMLDPEHHPIYHQSFGRDDYGFYVDTRRSRYYLDDDGVTSVSAYPHRTNLPRDAANLLRGLRRSSVYLMEDQPEVERRKYLEERLRAMETMVVTTDECSSVYVVCPTGTDGPCICNAEVFSIGHLPFKIGSNSKQEEEENILYAPHLQIIDPSLVDFDLLVSSESPERRMMDRELGFKLYANIHKMQEVTPISKLITSVLPTDGTRCYTSADDGGFCVCWSLDDYASYQTAIISSSGIVKLVEGKLKQEYGYAIYGKPVLRREGGWYSVEADGTCRKLDEVGEGAVEILCTGDTVLWKSGKTWYKGRTEVPELTDAIGEYHALISENVIATFKGSDLHLINFSSGERKSISIYEACKWNVLGLSDTGYLSMVHFVRDGNRVTAEFAELNMTTGAWKEFEGTLDIRVSMYEGSGGRDDRMWGSIFNYLDLRKQKILCIGSDMDKPMIHKYDLSKGEIRLSRNGLRANYTKKWVSPVELGGGRYLIATTEVDEDKKPQVEDNCEEEKEVPQNTRRMPSNMRAELRLMDSNTGTRSRGGGRSGGIMYGPKGYYLRERIHPVKVSPDRRFVFATYDSPETALNSFEVDAQKTYPETPVHGTVLEFLGDDRVLVGLFENKGEITLCQEFDYRLNPVGMPQKMLFTARDRYDGVDYDLDSGNDKDGIRWFSTEFFNRLASQGNLFRISESDEGKSEVDADLYYVRNGIGKNSIKWHVRFKPEYDAPNVNEIVESVKKTVRFAASEFITAVFDMADLDRKTRDGQYIVTVVRGETKVPITIQSPFEYENSYFPKCSPVQVLEDTFCYSATEDGHTCIKRCRLTEEGVIIAINSLAIPDDYHYVPLFADEDLLLLLREDGKLFHSYGWNGISETGFDSKSSYLLYGNMFLAGKDRGVYRLVNEGGESEFINGSLILKRGQRDYPKNLEMSTGTLEWREGIFTVKL